MGSSVTLTANGAASYSWNTSSTNSNIVVSPTVTTVYSVVGYSVNNPCPSPAKSATITILPQPTVGMTSSVYTVCPNGSVVFTATGAVSYFYPAFNLSTPTVQFNFASVTNTYMVIGTGPNSCTNAAVFTMSVLPAPTLTTTNSSNVICSGETITLTVSGANSYSWNTSATTPTIVVSPSVSAWYSVWGYNSFGCSSGSSMYILVNQSPTVSIASSTNLICGFGTATLTATGAPNYIWMSSQPGSSIAVSPMSTSIYSVAGWAANNCSAAAFYTLNASPPFVVYINGYTYVCAGQSATLTASGATTYTWVNGPVSTSCIVTPSVATMYSLNAQDALGCPGSSNYFVNVANGPTLTLSTNTNFICSGGTATLSATGADYYTWSNNTYASTTQVTAPDPVNVYTVTGTNTLGCSSTGTISISTIVSPTVNVSTSNSVICAGQSATLTAGGASTYSWSNSSFNNFIVDAPNTTTSYTVTGSFANGCSDTKVITQSVSTCANILGSSIKDLELIYPNPVNDKLHIKLSSFALNSSAEIYSALGQLLFIKKFETESMSIDLTKYVSGIYYVKIKKENAEEYFKIIKE
jgi:hypothetical protein